MNVASRRSLHRYRNRDRSCWQYATASPPPYLPPRPPRRYCTASRPDRLVLCSPSDGDSGAAVTGAASHGRAARVTAANINLSGFIEYLRRVEFGAVAASTGHAGVEERPALAAIEMLVPGLFLAARRFCLVLCPFLLGRIPLLFCPGLDARGSG